MYALYISLNCIKHVLRIFQCSDFVVVVVYPLCRIFSPLLFIERGREWGRDRERGRGRKNIDVREKYQLDASHTFPDFVGGAIL